MSKVGFLFFAAELVLAFLFAVNFDRSHSQVDFIACAVSLVFAAVILVREVR